MQLDIRFWSARALWGCSRNHNDYKWSENSILGFMQEMALLVPAINLEAGGGVRGRAQMYF